MALQGTLETFSVDEVFRLLAGTRKTGRLTLEGDLGVVDVWLSDGRICAVAAPVAIMTDRSDGEAAGRSVEDAVILAMRMTTGAFEFASGDHAPPSPSCDRDVDEVLAAAEARMVDLRTAESVIPSMASTLGLVPVLDGASVTIDRQDWALVVAVAGGRSADLVAAELDLDLIGLADRIRPLVDAGLVVVSGPQPDERSAPMGGATDTASTGPSNWMARDDWDDENADVTVAEVTDDDPEFGDGLDPDDATADLERIDRTAPASDADVVSQAQVLSAKAAAAVEAVTARSPESDSPVVAGRPMGDEDANRTLLLRFLSTTKP